MLDEVQQLVRMIQSLLDISRGDEGTLSPHVSKARVSDVVSDVFAELEAQAEDRGVSLISEPGVTTIEADEDLRRRMLANLIENAIRHAPRGTPVTVRSVANDAGTELCVVDCGGAIPDSLRESVFDPFVQLTEGGSAANPSERGLGLAFCKLVRTVHGGAISVEDAAPGARFRMQYPSTLPPAAMAAQ